MKFKKGDVICFENNGGIVPSIVGNLISFVETIGNIFMGRKPLPIASNRIIHVGLVINERLFLEAIGGGIQVAPIKELRGQNCWLCVLKESMRKQIDDNKFDGFVNRQIGKSYDYKGLFRLLPYLLTGKLFFKPKEDKNLNICAELIGSAFEAAGIIDENVSILTPSDIFEKDWYKERINLSNNLDVI